MWLAQVVQAGCVVLIAAATSLHMGRIWLLLYIAAFGLGAAETVFGNAAQSILPNVVAPAQLEAANGRQYATQTITEQFAGPPLGSLLFAAAAPLQFWLDALSFVLSAFLISRVRLAPSAGTAKPAAGPIRHDIAEGLRWIARHRLIRTFALLLAATNMAGQLAMSTLVLFAVRELHVGARGYGVMLAGGAVGGVVGGLVARRVVARLGTRGAIIAASALGTASVLVVGLFIRNPYLMPVCTAASGLSRHGVECRDRLAAPADHPGPAARAGQQRVPARRLGFDADRRRAGRCDRGDVGAARAVAGGRRDPARSTGDPGRGAPRVSVRGRDRRAAHDRPGYRNLPEVVMIEGWSRSTTSGGWRCPCRVPRST
jgi:hypothetical protein